MPDYKTLRGTSTFTYEEKRSRFIATADDLPETPAYTWAYANNNGTIIATGSVDGTPAVQYTFSIYNGSDLKWDARTVCTGGKSL